MKDQPVSFPIVLMSAENIKRRQITPWWPRVSDSSVSDLKICYEVWFRTLTFENVISNYCDQNLFTQQTPWERASRRKVFRIKNKQVFGECGSFLFFTAYRYFSVHLTHEQIHNGQCKFINLVSVLYT